MEANMNYLFTLNLFTYQFVVGVERVIAKMFSRKSMYHIRGGFGTSHCSRGFGVGLISGLMLSISFFPLFWSRVFILSDISVIAVC